MPACAAARGTTRGGSALRPLRSSGTFRPDTFVTNTVHPCPTIRRIFPTSSPRRR